MTQCCVWGKHKQFQLTQLDNRVHGANTSQNARQLILPDVCQPLCNGVLDHFVYTEETRKSIRRKETWSKKSQTTEQILASSKLERLSQMTEMYLR